MEKSNVATVRLGGADYVVIPRAEYERLRAGLSEDAALVAAGNAARGEETYPAEIARRLAAGENGLKVVREWRQMTQAALGTAADVPSQYISQIERKDRNMGHKTAGKLAAVLSVSPEILMEGQYEGGFQKVVRATMRMPDLD